MADLNPFSLWRRLLAAPNESRTKTVVMAFLVAAICGVLVSAATVYLRPIRAANQAAERQARLEALLAGVPGLSEMLAQSDGRLSTVVIDLGNGAAADDITPETLETALAEAQNWTALSPADDIADIGRRPDYAQVYLLRDGDRISLVLLPMVGAGYGGAIEAILALRGDMQTIAGFTVTRQSETPGLGARIEEPSWQADFAGTQAYGDGGEVRFAVARGSAGNEFEVDGITGATRTSNAVADMVRFWLGPDGYGPFIRAIRRGEF